MSILWSSDFAVAIITYLKQKLSQNYYIEMSNLKVQCKELRLNFFYKKIVKLKFCD